MLDKTILKILGFELASFLDKKSRCVKNIFFENYEDILGKWSGFFGILLDSLSRNDASSNPRIWIFSLEFTDRG